MKKKTKLRMRLKTNIIYILITIIFIFIIYIRYLLLVNDGQAISIKELNKIHVENRLKNKGTVIITNDSVILNKDSLVILLETEKDN